METAKPQKIKITYTNENINPVDFREYSDFEFRWVETILTKVIKRSDILILLRQFEIKFFEENWEENLPIAEMGNVLISDVPKKDLLPAVKEIMEKYPDKISFDKAEKIWGKLEKLNVDEIRAKFFEASEGRNLFPAKNKKMAMSFILKFIYQKGGDKIISKFF